MRVVATRYLDDGKAFNHGQRATLVAAEARAAAEAKAKEAAAKGK